MRITSLISPDVNDSDPLFVKRLDIKPEIFHEIASTFSGVAKDLLEGIAAHVSKNEIKTILGDSKDFELIENAIVALLRSGAFYMNDIPKATLSKQEQKGAECVSYILSWLKQDHQMKSSRSIESHSQSIKKPQTKTGYYGSKDSLKSNITDPISNDVEILFSESVDSSATVDLGNDESWKPSEAMHKTDSVKKNESSKNSKSQTDISTSINPAPDMNRQNRIQMLVAIIFAVILAGLLILGLVWISKAGEKPASSSKLLKKTTFFIAA